MREPRTIARSGWKVSRHRNGPQHWRCTAALLRRSKARTRRPSSLFEVDSTHDRPAELGRIGSDVLHSALAISSEIAAERRHGTRGSAVLLHSASGFSNGPDSSLAVNCIDDALLIGRLGGRQPRGHSWPTHLRKVSGGWPAFQQGCDRAEADHLRRRAGLRASQNGGQAGA